MRGVAFAFLTDDDVEWAEWWTPPNFVGWLDCPTDTSSDWERMLVELGLRVVEAAESENFGPDYRAWERADAIAWRLRRAA